MFERIFLAVEHRHLNLDPTLDEVTDDLQVLAKFLIRRQQLIGPYGLSARTNLGSGAWREYRAQELERLRLASETEGDRKHNS